MRVRRIVTGEPRSGGSTFTHVEEVVPLEPRAGFAQYHVWGWDGAPTLPLHQPEPYVARSHFPPNGGVRVTANVLGGVSPSSDTSDPDDEHRVDSEEFTRLIGLEPRGRTTGSVPGMHRTDTIDIGVVVSGQVTVECEDGSSVTMCPGDVYVQNGAQHAWRPNPDNPALVVFVLIGARRNPTQAE